METLTSGVLLKLLKDMGVEEKAVDDVKNPVLLQIRSIIPVLAEGDLWPSQGFFLKVADSTQAMFVSLAPEEDEMVLCNKLQLGQFIYVEKLEAAYPVPVLKGVMPIPGRQPCIGDPQDLLGVDILEKSCRASLLTKREKNGVKNKPRARYRSLSPSKVQPRERKESGASHSRPGASTPEDRRCRGMKPSCGDKDSDSDSTLSNPRRKSWSGITKTRSGEFSDCTVVKHEIKPVHRSDQSVCNLQGSPFRSAAASYENNEENTSTRTRIKDIALATRPVRTLNKSKNSLSERNSMELLTQVGVQASPSDRQWETEILWDYLPLTLVKLGKEILRQKDVALLAAVEALQEAAASERLLKCLSSLSELRLAKEDEQQDSIDKFFKLQDYMVESRGIIQSLTNISPLRSPEADSNNSRSIGEALKLAVERKRNATTWIKAAVASDLTLVSTFKPQNSSMEANNTTRRRNKQIHGNKPIGTLIARKQRSIDEVYVGLAAEKENQPDWVKGSALNTAADLAQALQDESRTWFLAYMENYLDGFAEESGIKLSDSQFAETMCQMKRLNDWLDVMEKRERSGNGSVPGSSELEACGRIKKKIYGILLKHVERTSRVLEKMTEI